MSHATAEEISKHIKTYIAVFIALAVLTLMTVGAAHLHVSKTLHIVIALLIAVVKGGLVAAFFMHLVSERKSIHSFLIITGLFFVVLLLLTLFSDVSMLRSELNYPGVLTPNPPAATSQLHPHH